jgi:hypothetical protein
MDVPYRVTLRRSATPSCSALDLAERAHQGSDEWELRAKKIDDHSSEYRNHIHASATDEFLEFIEKKNNSVTFEQAGLGCETSRDLPDRA